MDSNEADQILSPVDELSTFIKDNSEELLLDDSIEENNGELFVENQHYEKTNQKSGEEIDEQNAYDIVSAEIVQYGKTEFFAEEVSNYGYEIMITYANGETETGCPGWMESGCYINSVLEDNAGTSLDSNKYYAWNFDMGNYIGWKEIEPGSYQLKFYVEERLLISVPITVLDSADLDLERLQLNQEYSSLENVDYYFEPDVTGDYYCKNCVIKEVNGGILNGRFGTFHLEQNHLYIISFSGTIKINKIPNIISAEIVSCGQTEFMADHEGLKFNNYILDIVYEDGSHENYTYKYGMPTNFGNLINIDVVASDGKSEGDVEYDCLPDGNYILTFIWNEEKIAESPIVAKKYTEMNIDSIKLSELYYADCVSDTGASCDEYMVFTPHETGSYFFDATYYEYGDLYQWDVDIYDLNGLVTQNYENIYELEKDKKYLVCFDGYLCVPKKVVIDSVQIYQEGETEFIANVQELNVYGYQLKLQYSDGTNEILDLSKTYSNNTKRGNALQKYVLTPDGEQLSIENGCYLDQVFVPGEYKFVFSFDGTDMLQVPIYVKNYCDMNLPHAVVGDNKPVYGCAYYIFQPEKMGDYRLFAIDVYDANSGKKISGSPYSLEKGNTYIYYMAHRGK